MNIFKLESVLREVMRKVDCPIVLVLGKSRLNKPEFGIFPMTADSAVVEKTVKRLKQKLSLDDQFSNFIGASLYRSIVPDTRKDIIPIVQSTLVDMEQELVFIYKVILNCVAFNLANEFISACPCISSW